MSDREVRPGAKVSGNKEGSEIKISGTRVVASNLMRFTCGIGTLLREFIVQHARNIRDS